MSDISLQERMHMSQESFTVPYEGGAVVDWSNLDGYSERERKMLAYVEKVTSEPKLEQELLLKYILTKNANTEYLQKHGMDGATDLKSFRKRVPVVDYEAYRSSIDRIANGDTSHILTADPPVEVLLSSGTTGGGDPKMFPVTAEDLNLRTLVWEFISPVLSRALPSLKRGKYMSLIFLRESSQTPGGLLKKTAVTSFIQCKSYKKRLFQPIYNLSSPPEVCETPDTNSAMYSHLLCSLLQRDEIRRIGALYATLVIRSLRLLELWWPDICEDIATGTINKARVQDETVRKAVMPLLLERSATCRAELAENIRKECMSDEGHFNQNGLIPRLWPNIQVIDTAGTGAMKVQVYNYACKQAQNGEIIRETKFLGSTQIVANESMAYLPALANYSNNLRVICTPLYSSTECYIGVNINPSLPPEETYYVLIPTVAYFEFIPICGASVEQRSPSIANSGSSGDIDDFKVHPVADHDSDGDSCRDASAAGRERVLDLTSLTVGGEYQILISTVSGYYRLLVGDIVKVVGTYNNSPLFEYIRRMKTVLSVDCDKTDEVELHAAVNKATQILELEVPGYKLLEYTSYTHLVVQPGHYVIVWELASVSSSTTTTHIPSSVMDQCCSALEASFNFIYREGRYEGKIGPLELILVMPGTFDLIFELSVSRGGSINQYHLPRGLGPEHAALREILEARVSQRHFSLTRPLYIPGQESF